MDKETFQDALVPAPRGQAGQMRTVVDTYIATLQDAGVLRPEHQLTIGLVQYLATAADATGRGYAAAQIGRELREAMSFLPALEDNEDSSDLDELDIALRAVLDLPDRA